MQLTGSRPSSPRTTWATLRAFFWIFDLAVLALFAFFLALGAFGLGDSTVLTALIAGLGVLYVVHVILMRRRDDGHREAALARDRERRGF